MFTAISGENLNKLLGGGTIKGQDPLGLAASEGTAGVCAVVQHDLVPQGAAPAKPGRTQARCSRAERPQKGRQRQFNQRWRRVPGAEDPSVDAEGIIMLMRFFAAIGTFRWSATRLLVNSPMGCEQLSPGVPRCREGGTWTRMRTSY